MTELKHPVTNSVITIYMTYRSVALVFDATLQDGRIVHHGGDVPRADVVKVGLIIRRGKTEWHRTDTSSCSSSSARVPIKHRR